MSEQPRTAAGRDDRELFLKIAAHLQKVARETGYTHPEHLSGHEYPATDIPCLPETIAEQVVEGYLIEAQARPAGARSEGLRAALEEALDGWESADLIVDHDRRVSSDPPCEDEARIAAIRATFASAASSDIEQESGSGNRWASRRNGEQRPAVGPRESSDAVRGAEVKALDPSRGVPAVIGDAPTPDSDAGRSVGALDGVQVEPEPEFSTGPRRPPGTLHRAVAPLDEERLARALRTAAETTDMDDPTTVGHDKHVEWAAAIAAAYDAERQGEK